MSDKKLVVRQVRSSTGRDKSFRKVLAAMGLGRIGNESVLPSNPSVLGMLRVVKHVVEVKDAK